MSKPIPAETNNRIRALIKEGFAYVDIARECGVSDVYVRRQAVMLEALGAFKRISRLSAIQKAAQSSVAENGTTAIRKASLAHGRDVDDAGIDLVSLFETPRTPKQLKRFWSGE